MPGRHSQGDRRFVEVQTGSLSAEASPMSSVAGQTGSVQSDTGAAVLGAAGAAGDPGLEAALIGFGKALAGQLQLAAYSSDRLATRLATASEAYTRTDSTIGGAH